MLVIVFLFHSALVVTGFSQCRMDVKESLFWSFVTDCLPFNSNEALLIYRTGFTGEDHRTGQTATFLDGDIIEAIEDNGTVYVLGRAGLLYMLSVSGDSFYVKDIVETGCEILDMDVKNGRALLMADTSCFLYDFSSSSNTGPVVLDFPARLSGVALSSEICYIATGSDSIFLYSIADTKTEKIDIGRTAERLANVGDMLIVTTFESPIVVYNIAEDSLVLAAELGSREEYYTDFAEFDGFLYAAIMDRGLVGWDMSAFPDEEQIFDMDIWKPCRSLAISGDMAYFANGPDGWSEIDLGKPDYVNHDDNLTAIDVELVDDVPFVALGGPGIGVLAASGDTVFATDGFCRGVSQAGRHVLACVEGLGLEAFVLDSLGLPVLRHTFPCEWAFCSGGNERYFGWFDMATRQLIFKSRMGDDFTGALDKGSFEMRMVRELSFDRNICAAALDMQGFGIFELGDSATMIATVETGGNVRSVLLEKDMLYIADGRKGISMWDIGDPLAPRVQWEYELPGASDIAVSGNLIAVSMDNGIAIFRSNGDRSPELLCQRPNAGLGTRVAISGHTVYLADQYSLYVLEVVEE